MKYHYSMIIEWSDRDKVFIVSFPEWEEQAHHMGHTHGETYAEAVKQGEELLELLIEDQLAEGLPMPQQRVFAATV
jgi:predicted RNase H-like HicB family nuclease